MLTSMSANAEQEVCLHSRHRVKKIYKVTYYRITVFPVLHMPLHFQIKRWAYVQERTERGDFPNMVTSGTQLHPSAT